MRRDAMGRIDDHARPNAATSPRAVLARVVRGGGGPVVEKRFTRTFTVGRSDACDLRVADPSLGSAHLRVVFDGSLWWVRDLGTGSGTFLERGRIAVEPLASSAELELGRGGTVLSLTVLPPERAGVPVPSARRVDRSAADGRPISEARIERCLRRPGDGPAACGTMAPRRAHGQAGRRSSLLYGIAIGVVLLLLASAAGVAWERAQRLHDLRIAAERLFYATRSVELETARLEELAALRASPEAASQVAERRARVRQLEAEYERFVQDLGLQRNVPDDERVIVRVARIFGECDVAVPDGFVKEVRAYVERWRSTDRLARALRRLRDRGHAPAMARAFTDVGLPPHYLYLALQESAFDERAVGPPTRFGYAKGMWQFIAPTAAEYGLRVGPRRDEPVYDAEDDRFDRQKATAAAARYLKDLQSTDAQASGLLALASYNWGQQNVRATLRRLPATPQERNFWRLLSDRTVPRETYDYVLSIVSAAVICEDPGLFGFDVDCPLRGGSASPGEPALVVTPRRSR